jgi:hypothetical protein
MERLAWGASIALAIAGIVLYVTSWSDWAWWIGTAMISPLGLMAVWRANKKDSFPDGADGDGTWGPP